MPWQPDPSWKPMAAGAGQSNGGVWLTPDRRVVKRLLPGVEDQRHHAYWRRQAEVAASGIVATTPGLRSPGCVRVDRDADGITLWMTEVEAVTHEPLELARALGRFGSARITEPEWGTRGISRDRLARVARRGGWVGIAYRDGAPDQTLVRRGAVLTAAYTAISRAAWAHSQPEPGDHLDRLNRLADIVAEACGTS